MLFAQSYLSKYLRKVWCYFFYDFFTKTSELPDVYKKNCRRKQRLINRFFFFFLNKTFFYLISCDIEIIILCSLKIVFCSLDLSRKINLNQGEITSFLVLCINFIFWGLEEGRVVCTSCCASYMISPSFEILPIPFKTRQLSSKKKKKHPIYSTIITWQTENKPLLTVYIKMRWLIISHLIWVQTVCNSQSDFCELLFAFFFFFFFF